MSADNNTDDLTTSDGRKITAFSSSGESYSVESTEQTAKGKLAELELELAKRRAAMNPLLYWNGADRNQRR